MNYFPKSDRHPNLSNSARQDEASLSIYNPPSNDQESVEGGLDLAQLFATVKRRWLVLVGVTIAVTSGTIFWSMSRPSHYQGQFQILVEPVTAEGEFVSAATGGNQSITDQDLGETQVSSAQLDYPTQIEVLLSRKLLVPVVNSLQPQFPSIEYGQLRRRLNIYRQEDEGSGSATKILVFDYQAPTSEEVESVSNALSRAYIKYSLQERQTNLKRAVQFSDKQLPLLKAQVNQLELQLQQFRERNQVVDPDLLSQQVTQQFRDLQQQLASTQIELLQQRRLYASLQQQLQQQPSSAEAGSVLSEAPEYRRLVDQLQEIETQLEIQSAQLTANHPILIDLQAQRDRLLPLVQQKARSSLGTQLYEQVGDPSALPYQNGLRQALSKQLVDTALQVQVLESRSQGTIKLKRDLEKRMLELPKIARQHEALKRQLDIATNNLEGFLKTREELLLSAAREEVPWELIEPPTQPTEVTLSNLSRDISLGSFLGVLLGLGLAILIDKTSNVVHETDELKLALDLPIIGKIPTHDELNKIAFETSSSANDLELLDIPISKEDLKKMDGGGYGFSHFLESFRALNVQLQMLRPDRPVQSLVISSCMPGEGKSTVAIHLAQAAAAMGKRVLLVDADLRLPNIHNLLELEQRPGLSELMVLEKDPTLVIRQTSYEENLFVLTAGTQPTDPSRFLSAQKMQGLMDHFAEQYDLVIYDAPPLTLSETILLSTSTDGLLLVTKLGSIKNADLREMRDRLEQSKVSVLGVVANKVRSPSARQAYGYGKSSKDRVGQNDDAEMLKRYS